MGDEEKKQGRFTRGRIMALSENTAVLNIDGNCGFALIGRNIQEGECAFVCVDGFHESVLNEDGSVDPYQLKKAEKWAMSQALRNLKKRLGYSFGYYIEADHWN